MGKPISTDDILRFYDICNDAYMCWRIRRVVFDDNDNMDNIIKKCGNANWCFITVGKNLVELFVLKIGRLHDSFSTKGNINLSIDYILESCTFDEQTAKELFSLKTKLDNFYIYCKKYRNKVLAHTDRKTVMKSGTIGDFPKDADIEYFENLQKFVNIVAECFDVGPLQFFDTINVEAQELLLVLLKGFEAVYNVKFPN